MYQIPASGGRHLGNMVLPPPASLSHFSSPSLFVYLSIQQNSTRGLLDLHRLIAHLTCAHIFDVRLTIEGHVRDMLGHLEVFVFSSCLLPPLCPNQRVKHHNGHKLFATFNAGSHYLPCLSTNTRAQLEIQISKLFCPLVQEWYNHSQPISSLQRATVMQSSTQACSIEYLSHWPA